MALQCNVGGADRAVRIGLGAAATGAGLFFAHGWRRALALGLGAVGLFTGISHYCPINQATGRDTCHLAGEGQS